MLAARNRLIKRLQSCSAWGRKKRTAKLLVSSNEFGDIAATIRSANGNLIIIDSIQTLSLDEITSAPGTVSQITNSSNVIRAAKQSGAAVILVGHVTKEGSIAGPAS